jgi:hypothetical protein
MAPGKADAGDARERRRSNRLEARQATNAPTRLQVLPLLDSPFAAGIFIACPGSSRRCRGRPRMTELLPHRMRDNGNAGSRPRRRLSLG